MVADLRCFDNTVRADMDMIANLHRIVVEVASIGLVRRSTGYQNNSIRGDVLQTRLWTYLITQPSPIRQYRPREITTACPGPVLLRSPRIMAPLAMIVFPPRIMFCGPAIVARLETLLPVSYILHMNKSFEILLDLLLVKLASNLLFRCTLRARSILDSPCLKYDKLKNECVMSERCDIKGFQAWWITWKLPRSARGMKPPSHLYAELWHNTLTLPNHHRPLHNNLCDSVSPFRKKTRNEGLNESIFSGKNGEICAHGAIWKRRTMVAQNRTPLSFYLHSHF